jgi:hypothetical protein
MIEFKYTGEELYARMERAVKKVNQRLHKTVQTIEARTHDPLSRDDVRGYVSHEMSKPLKRQEVSITVIDS